MRNLKVIAATVLAAGIASGQWLETTIPMPQPPKSVAYNQANDQVYCAVGYPDAFGALVVADGETHEVVDTVMLGYDMPGRVLCDPGHNRVYCAGSSFWPLDDSLVTVVDGASDSIVAEIRVGSGPMALAFNESGNKLYCAAQLPGLVHVIDCDADTVLNVLQVGRCPYDLVYAADVDKVYCANRGDYMNADHTVYVIDGSTNNILGVINVGNFPRALCYNPVNQKLYCANGMAGSVSVIDVQGDTVITTVSVAASPIALCWNPANNRVYCSNESDPGLAVIDGVTNNVVSTVTMDGPAWAVAADSANNKVYCANSMNDIVTVVDGSADTVMTVVSVGTGPESMHRRADVGRTYVCNTGDPSVSVIKDSVPAGVEEERTKAEGQRTSQTICRGSLVLLEAVGGERSAIGAHLLDISGREVMDLYPGSNDVSGVSPGVYFLRSADGGKRSAVRKVVIQR